MAEVFQRDEDGNVINPPTLPEWEDRINRAALSGNDAEVQRVQEGYHQARDEEIRRIEGEADTAETTDETTAPVAPDTPGDTPADVTGDPTGQQFSGGPTGGGRQ